MKISINTEKPPRFLIKLKDAFAKKSLSSPNEPEIVDGLVNTYIKNRIAVLKINDLWFVPKRTEGEEKELAFLEEELASGRHAVHNEDFGCLILGFLLKIFFVITVGIPLSGGIFLMVMIIIRG